MKDPLEPAEDETEMTMRAESGPNETTGWQPLHQSLVHKRDGRQVILRGTRINHERLTFDISGARARLGSMLDDAGFVAETLRQSTIALAHLRYGVPSDWAFLMDRMRFRVHTRSLSDQPPTIARISARDVSSRGFDLHSLRSVLEVLSGDDVVATGEGYLRVVSQQVYRRLRSGHPVREPSRRRERRARPITLSQHASHDPDVLNAEWVPSIDSDDPFFFDHGVDHIPGMAIYESACAVATLTSPYASPRVDFFDGSFHQFVELDGALILSKEPESRVPAGGSYSVGVTASSNGRLVMSASIGLSAAHAISELSSDGSRLALS